MSPVLDAKIIAMELLAHGQIRGYILFRIRLSFPLLANAVNQEPVVIKFADTNNSVSIEYPKPGPAPEHPEIEGFAEIVLRVERECTATKLRPTPWCIYGG